MTHTTQETPEAKPHADEAVTLTENPEIKPHTETQPVHDVKESPEKKNEPQYTTEKGTMPEIRDHVMIAIMATHKFRKIEISSSTPTRTRSLDVIYVRSTHILQTTLNDNNTLCQKIILKENSMYQS